MLDYDSVCYLLASMAKFSNGPGAKLWKLRQILVLSSHRRRIRLDHFNAHVCPPCLCIRDCIHGGFEDLTVTVLHRF